MENRRVGWQCPVCGRGVSPWTNICPCFDIMAEQKHEKTEQVHEAARKKETAADDQGGGVAQSGPFPTDKPIPAGTIEKLAGKMKENKRETCAKVAAALDPDTLSSEEEQKICDRIEGKKAEERKSKVDHGRIMALHAAGWPIKEIAADCKCSEQTVRNHIMKEQKK